MLIPLAAWLQSLDPEQFGALRVFQYLTFRAVMAAMTALLIGLALGPIVIGGDHDASCLLLAARPPAGHPRQRAPYGGAPQPSRPCHRRRGGNARPGAGACQPLRREPRQP